MTDYTELCDELFELESEIKERKKRVDFLKEQLKENLKNGESVTASNGYTFTVSRQIKNKYGEEAAMYLLNETDAVELFVSISDAALTKAKKQGRLCAADLAVLEGMAEQTTSLSVRSKAPSIDQVIPEKVGM